MTTKFRKRTRLGLISLPKVCWTAAMTIGLVAVSSFAYASALSFREHTYDFDGGPRTDYVAQTGGMTITYRPLPGWRFWQLDSGGAFEDAKNPYAGQLRFEVKAAPVKSAPSELDEEALTPWFQTFVPSDAENVSINSVKLGFKKFLEGKLSACQMNYEVDGSALAMNVWIYPLDSARWLCISYMNRQGGDFSKYVTQIQNSLNILDVAED